MPHICCAARCFNKCSDRYALFRFPKENQYRKAWVDAVFGENTSRSLDSLRVCEAHFEPSDILVVGRGVVGGCRKEAKKGAIPSRFCHCPSENFCKSQARKRKKDEVHVRNVKIRRIFDSHICQAVDTCEHCCISVKNVACSVTNHIMKNVAKLSKKQLNTTNHLFNCPFLTLPLSINKIKKRCSIKENCIMSNTENVSPKKIVRKLTKEDKLLKKRRNVMELLLQNKF